MPPPATALDLADRRRGARRRLVVGRRVPAASAAGPTAEESGAMLELAGVYKTFRRGGRSVTALAGVDLRVERGEFVCLLGPSGCGKSTALNLAAGILDADGGTVSVEGRPVVGPSPERAMLFQSPLLFPWLTIRQNVLFGPRAQRRSGTKAEHAAEADAILATVGLSGFEEAYPQELSGGMRHRAAFARVMINRPAVVLMDEPFGALDSLTRSKMHAFLLELRDAHQMTIVFVTHDIEEAVLLGDRVCIFGGSPSRIVHEYVVPLERPRHALDVETEQFLAAKRSVRALLALDEQERAAAW
jgi:ABC-type nitrate/sulfonate/bicarbonate transport system ATPase subunit